MPSGFCIIQAKYVIKKEVLSRVLKVLVICLKKFGRKNHQGEKLILKNLLSKNEE
jgi:hypothetical protein